MPEQDSTQPSHDGTYYCEECLIDVRVGVIDGDSGLFCGCTVADGKPFKRLNAGMVPWPDRWNTREEITDAQ